MLATIDRGRVQNEAKERNIDDIRKDLELASIDNDQLLANQVNLDMQIKVGGPGREEAGNPRVLGALESSVEGFFWGGGRRRRPRTAAEESGRVPGTCRPLG